MNITAKAFLFDLNGTIIDDMNYHTTAWQNILNNDLGANFTREEVKAQMYGKNQEVLTRFFGKDHFTMERMNELSFEKSRLSPSMPAAVATVSKRRQVEYFSSTARPPMSLATRPALSADRSKTATRAPAAASRRQMASPIP